MKLKIIIASVLFLSLTLFGQQGLWRLIKLKQMARTLQQETERFMVQNTSLAREIKRLAEPEYLERLIRQERGYLREGERLVELPLDSSPDPL